MRAVVLGILVFAVACASRPTVLTGPTADPARIADGYRVLPGESARATVRVRTANEVTTVFTIPANVPHYVAFCDPTHSWSSAKWFLIRIDNVDQQNFGPVSAESEPNCYRTPTGYSFATGDHQVDVLLVNHCEVGAMEPLCLDGDKNPPVTTIDQYGNPTIIRAVTVNLQLIGAPPSIISGQVIR